MLEALHDDAVTHLSHVLSCLHLRTITHVRIMFRGSGTEAVVSSTAYNVLDAAISLLNRRSKKQVQVQMGWSFRAAFSQTSSVPKCLDSYNGEILPRCAAEGLLVQCNGIACGVHKDEDDPHRIRGTLQYLLNVLPGDEKVKQGIAEIVIDSPLVESLGAASQMTWAVWEQIEHFSRSGGSIDQFAVYIEGVGKISLSQWLFRGALLSQCHCVALTILLFQSAFS